MKREDSDSIIHLIVKSLRKELTPQEWELFQRWISQSKTNEKMYQRLENEYYHHVEYPFYERFNSRKEWDVVKRGIRKRRRVRRLSRSALVAASLLAGVFLYYTFSLKKEEPLYLFQTNRLDNYSFSKKANLILANGDTLQINPVKMDMIVEELPFVSNSGEALIYSETEVVDTLSYNTLEIPRGGAYSLQLADGTKVMLNSDSRLRYPLSFTGNSREVFLEGEGFFQVAQNTKKPFIVHCAGYRVRVLGTIFNISAYPADGISMTTLVEGRVNIEKGNTIVPLTPGTMASVTSSGITTQNIEIDSYISWTEDRFSFSEERLDDLLKKIARWYDVEFIFKDPILKDHRFSGFMPRYVSIVSVLQIMEQAADITFDMSDKGKLLVRKKRKAL